MPSLMHLALSVVCAVVDLWVLVFVFTTWCSVSSLTRQYPCHLKPRCYPKIEIPRFSRLPDLPINSAGSPDKIAAGNWAHPRRGTPADSFASPDHSRLASNSPGPW